ncbi:MAG: cytochrome c [Magnetococcales bacterium]|nr:cytochrome c [Magnetococcales bacterium]
MKHFFLTKIGLIRFVLLLSPVVVLGWTSPLFASGVTVSGGFQMGGGAIQEQGPLVLSAEVKKRVVEDMAQLNQDFALILQALIIGDHPSLGRRADAIEQLTAHEDQNPEKRWWEDEGFPPEFIRLRRRLHRFAAQLTRAAQDRDLATEQFLFNRMLDTCVGCHQTYSNFRASAVNPAESGHLGLGPGR